jgi:hypothetical protein
LHEVEYAFAAAKKNAKRNKSIKQFLNAPTSLTPQYDGAVRGGMLLVLKVWDVLISSHLL